MSKGKRNSKGKKILIITSIVLALLALAFHLFITRYLPPLVKERLKTIIINGSDSLYKVEMGKFNLSFWGGTAHFSDLHITIDSNRYKKMNEANDLPPISFELVLPEVDVKGIRLGAFIFSKKIVIRSIIFNRAAIQLARHFKTKDTIETNTAPLWKLIQPDVRSISIQTISCADLKVQYRNIDSAKSFQWQFEKCNFLVSGIRVDSLASTEKNRLLYANNLALKASDVKMKTPDGLYDLQAKEIMYTSAESSLKVNQFKFLPAVSEQSFISHFGYQHEIYRLSVDEIALHHFRLPQWTRYNRLQVDSISLNAPSILIKLDRNAKPYPYSKMGKYPQQLLQKAPFTIQVNQLTAKKAKVEYQETNNKTKLTGKLVFPDLYGEIQNITNDPVAIAKLPACIVTVDGTVMQRGQMHTVFRFNLNDEQGSFTVRSRITGINAQQIQPLFKAMTAVDIQSLNIGQLDYSIQGNEYAGHGNLRMKYTDMDILLNKVEGDKNFNKQGILSFFANRLGIYKANPMNNEDERIADNVVVQRDMSRSFFNLVWKTMFNAAGEIVLRPLAKRKIENQRNKKNSK